MNRKTWFHLAVLPVFALLAVGSSSPKKDGADDKSATTTTTAGKLGTATTIGDSEWTVIDIVNRGTQMKPNESYEKDAVTTGSFIQVHFKIANKSKKEGVIGDVPKLVDATGREFGTIENASSFRPKDTNGVFLDKLQPSATKEFTEIYELPAGVTQVSMKAHDFGLFGSDKTIQLGALPAAPPAPVAAASAVTAKPAAKAAAPAAKAKAAAAPAKK
ncbi:MAG: hypothetical protein JWO86_5504 [Myxococcaceae bacterium]|nr:hypothetical protein [Myxococcaceae bacterium]